MVEYLENGDLALYNGYKFRKDKRTGYYLSSRIINGKRRRLHVYIWECENGEIPNGYSVHHQDEDKSNNEISNLELMTNSKHTRLHAEEKARNNYDDMLKNLKENAIPASKDWHKSKDGSEWHKKHYEQMKGKMKVPRKFVCEYCNKEFVSTQTRSRFCSNKCKSAWRRKSGVDDVIKICCKCGKEYVANKYQKTKYCPVCKNKKC